MLEKCRCELKFFAFSSRNVLQAEVDKVVDACPKLTKLFSGQTPTVISGKMLRVNIKDDKQNMILGAGVFGTVFQGRMKNTAQPIALKVFQGHDSKSISNFIHLLSNPRMLEKIMLFCILPL